MNLQMYLTSNTVCIWNQVMSYHQEEVPLVLEEPLI